MKKIVAMILGITMVVSLTGCGSTDIHKKSEGVMTFAEYQAAELDSEVVVETFVQAKQKMREEGGVLYTQDKDGGYFIYGLPCTQEEYDKITPGTKVKITGYKAEWSGEIEIVDPVYEIEKGSYIAEASDVTPLLGTDALAEKMNQYVSFKDMVVEPSGEEGSAFLYNWDGSGSEGDDLYFNVSANGATYSFTVPTRLCDKNSDVYKTVQSLNVGDKVDLEGFLYWYEGPNPHITKVTVK